MTTPKLLKELSCNQTLLIYFVHGVYSDVLNRICLYIDVTYWDILYDVEFKMLLCDFIDLLEIIKLYAGIHHVKQVIVSKKIIFGNEKRPGVALLTDRGYLPYINTSFVVHKELVVI